MNAASERMKTNHACFLRNSKRIDARKAPKTPTAQTTVIQLGIC
jgi:hypothetical protein